MMPGRRRIEDKYPNILNQLGKWSDNDVAIMFRCSPVTVRNMRRKRGIDSYNGPERRTPVPGEGIGLSSGSVPMHLDKRAVVVLYRAHHQGSEVTVHMLNSYSGIRVFDRDHVDARILISDDSPIPHFENCDDAFEYLLKQPGKVRPCLVSFVSAYRRFDGPWADFRPNDEVE